MLKVTQSPKKIVVYMQLQVHIYNYNEKGEGEREGESKKKRIETWSVPLLDSVSERRSCSMAGSVS